MNLALSEAWLYEINGLPSIPISLELAESAVISPSVSCRTLMNLKVTSKVCSGITIDAVF